MSRATRALLATVDEIDPQNAAANDELPVTGVAPGDPVPVELTAWIDALVPTLAAGLRLGESGRDSATSTTSPPGVATQSAQGDMDAVLTVNDTAAMLKLGRNAVYEAVARGEIPHRRIGNRLRFSKTALIRWLGGNNAPR